MTKPTPIIELAARLRRLPIGHQVAHLQALVKLEKPFSVRRNELESLLRGKMAKQLRKESGPKPRGFRVVAG